MILGKGYQMLACTGRSVHLSVLDTSTNTGMKVEREASQTTMIGG